MLGLKDGAAFQQCLNDPVLEYPLLFFGNIYLYFAFFSSSYFLSWYYQQEKKAPAPGITHQFQCIIHIPLNALYDFGLSFAFPVESLMGTFFVFACDITRIMLYTGNMP